MGLEFTAPRSHAPPTEPARRLCTTSYLSKEYKTSSSKECMHPDVDSSIIYNSQIMETAQVSIDGWIDKEEIVYTYSGILVCHKKEWNLAIYNDMDAKPSKLVRGRQILYDLTHTWNLRNKANGQREKKRGKPRNRLLTLENKVMVT